MEEALPFEFSARSSPFPWGFADSLSFCFLSSSHLRSLSASAAAAAVSAAAAFLDSVRNLSRSVTANFLNLSVSNVICDNVFDAARAAADSNFASSNCFRRNVTSTRAFSCAAEGMGLPPVTLIVPFGE